MFHQELHDYFGLFGINQPSCFTKLFCKTTQSCKARLTEYLIKIDIVLGVNSYLLVYDSFKGTFPRGGGGGGGTGHELGS